MKKATVLGTEFAVHKSVRDNIIDNIRSYLHNILQMSQQMITIIIAQAPTNNHNRNKSQDYARLLGIYLEKVTNKISERDVIKILLGYSFKAKTYLVESTQQCIGRIVELVTISNKNSRKILSVRTRKGFFEYHHHLLRIKIRPIPQNTKIMRSKLVKPDPQYPKANQNRIIKEINQNT